MSAYFTNNHVFLLMSGGYDSTALACYFLERGDAVHPVKMHYDSRQLKSELMALECVHCSLQSRYGRDRVAEIMDVQVPLLNPSSLSLHKSADQIETTDYVDCKNISTLVPGRNLAFLAMLANIAESYAVAHPTARVTISSGVHNSDWEMYPDCRPSFLESFKETVGYSSGNRVTAEFPFMYRAKTDFMKLVAQKHSIASFQNLLTDTYSCYRGAAIHCGTCPTCRERHQAFLMEFGSDHTEYEHPFED